MALDARVDEHPGGMSQGGALSELETSVLQVEQRATERVAILRVLNGLLHRSFGDGRCGDADQQTLLGQLSQTMWVSRPVQ